MLSCVKSRGLTQHGSEFRQEADLHHLVSESRVEGEVEQEAQRDVQQVVVIAWHQATELLDGVHVCLRHTQNSALLSDRTVSNEIPDY